MTTIDKQRALAFARVSTDRQAEEDRTSLDEQLLAMRKYAAANGYRIVEELREAVSGRKQHTEGLQRVYDLAEDGAIDAVLVFNWKRLARSVQRFENFAATMKLAGVDVISLDGQSNRTAAGRAMNKIQWVFAELNRDELVETMQGGKRGQARRGNVVPGRYPPLGFQYDRDKRTYTIDDSRMIHVRQVFRMVGAEGKSLGAVLRAFEGIPTVGGGKWHRNTFRVLINNDLYLPHTYEQLQDLVELGNLLADVLAGLKPDRVYGIYWYNRHRVEPINDDQHIRTDRPSEEHIAVPVDITDAGLDANLVAAAREVLQRNVRPSNAGRRPWELKGFAFCPGCGSRLTAHTVTGGRPRFHYVCMNRQKCQDAKFHRAEALEQQVRQYALNLIRNPKTLRQQVEAEAQRLKESLKDTVREARRWQRQLDQTDAERDRLIRLYMSGRIQDAEYDQYMGELEQVRAEAETELQKLRDSRRRISWLDDLPELVESYLKDLPYLMEMRPYKYDGNPPKVERLPSGLPKPYRVSLDTATHRPREIDQEAESQKWRGLYEDLGLRATVGKDGTLDISWGCKSLDRLRSTSAPRS